MDHAANTNVLEGVHCPAYFPWIPQIPNLPEFLFGKCHNAWNIREPMNGSG